MQKVNFPSIKNFTLTLQPSLLEPEWYLAKQGVCPLCRLKMKLNLKADKYICKGSFRGRYFHKSKAFKVK